MIYPITPVAKPRMTRRDKWQQRPVVMKYRAFKDECRLRGLEFRAGDWVQFLMPMPKSWSKKKKLEMVYTPHLQTPDADNMVKALGDAVHADDSAIYGFWVEKIWAFEGGIVIARFM